METGKSALLVGASGLVGRNLLQLLLREERYKQVRVLVRRSLPIRDPNQGRRVTGGFFEWSISRTSSRPRPWHQRMAQKGEVEQAVSKLPFSSVLIFRPSFLLGQRGERRRGEKAGIILVKLLQPSMIGGWRKFRPIHAKAVAGAMVLIAGMNKQGVNVFESDQIQILGSSQGHEAHPLPQTMEQE